MNKFGTFFIGFLLALHLASMLVSCKKDNESPMDKNSTGNSTGNYTGTATTAVGGTTTTGAKGGAECVRSAALLLLPAILAAFLFYGRR
ncbi:hypothetical protein NHX12_019116 [Muraenolepis orangiensis]|uniref:Uncharacterized protein n=1 Tax=Muraenolepis orangiensis TaxID=630683 RepID=A0A9Q0ETA5_9TELE|nr:hypothetical protein NHX12_019116 [Muraenolepis orangiensis]